MTAGAAQQGAGPRPRGDETGGAVGEEPVVQVSVIVGSDDVRVHGLSVDQVIARLSYGGRLPVVQVTSEAGRRAERPDLSLREIQVLRLIAAGRSNDAVADELSLSTNTIKTHIRTAYRKIGATSRSQAVLWAVRNGMAAPPAPVETDPWPWP